MIMIKFTIYLIYPSFLSRRSTIDKHFQFALLKENLVTSELLSRSNLKFLLVPHTSKLNFVFNVILQSNGQSNYY